jgi:hypothetical protein
MSIAQMSTEAPGSSTAAKRGIGERLRTIVFLVIAGLATLGWAGFLIWVALALLGF